MNTDAMMQVGIAFKNAQTTPKMMSLLPLTTDDQSILVLLGVLAMAIWSYSKLSKKKELIWISDEDLKAYNLFIQDAIKALPVPKDGEVFHDAPDPFVMWGSTPFPRKNCRLIVLSKRSKSKWLPLFHNNLMENGIMIIIDGHADKNYRVIETRRKKSYYNRDW